MTSEEIKKLAESFQGTFEWVEEGFPPECDYKKGMQEAIYRIEQALQEVEQRTAERCIKIANEHSNKCPNSYNCYKEIEMDIYKEFLEGKC